MTTRRRLLLFGLLVLFVIVGAGSVVIWSQLIRFARTGTIPDCLPIPHRVLRELNFLWDDDDL